MTAEASGATPLAGYRVAVTAERRREELGAALERRGAQVTYAPAIRIVPLADDALLREATARCVDAPPDVVIVTTGVGLRGWLDAAAAWGSADALIAAMGRARILARGPKARGAVRAAGLREDWSPASESSAELLEHLLGGDGATGSGGLAGTRIALQLHGDPHPGLADALRAAGADVVEAPVYRWEPPADPAPLHQLIAATAARDVDVVTFTSAPAATSFLQAADSAGQAAAVRGALQADVLAACVGPVTAGPLLSAGIPVLQPERGRLGALVREIAEQAPRRLGPRRAI